MISPEKKIDTYKTNFLINYLKGTTFLDSNLNYDSFASGCNLYLRNRLHNINVKPILIKFMQKMYVRKKEAFDGWLITLYNVESLLR